MKQLVDYLHSAITSSGSGSDPQRQPNRPDAGCGARFRGAARRCSRVWISTWSSRSRCLLMLDSKTNRRKGPELEQQFQQSQRTVGALFENPPVHRAFRSAAPFFSLFVALYDLRFGMPSGRGSKRPWRSGYQDLLAVALGFFAADLAEQTRHRLPPWSSRSRAAHRRVTLRGGACATTSCLMC